MYGITAGGVSSHKRADVGYGYCDDDYGPLGYDCDDNYEPWRRDQDFGVSGCVRVLKSNPKVKKMKNWKRKRKYDILIFEVIFGYMIYRFEFQSFGLQFWGLAYRLIVIYCSSCS